MNFSGGYSSSQNIQTGYLVSLDTTNSQTVDPASVNNVNNLAGVVINRNSSNISFNGPGSTIEVGTSGVYNADVSTINGNISKGDKITASIIEGVGMKATNATRIVGVALQSFNSNSSNAVKETITGQKTIYAGQIPINISIGDYSGQPIAQSTNPTIRPFQNFFAKTINKNVNQNQTLIAMVLILVCLVVALSLILISTVVSIRSIGRNPLARKGITRHTILIIIAVTVILLVSFVASYFILVG
ncbi:MAG: hypothetical protein WCI60_01615 [bacterium]